MAGGRRCGGEGGVSRRRAAAAATALYRPRQDSVYKFGLAPRTTIASHGPCDSVPDFVPRYVASSFPVHAVFFLIFYKVFIFNKQHIYVISPF